MQSGGVSASPSPVQFVFRLNERMSVTGSSKSTDLWSWWASLLLFEEFRLREWCRERASLVRSTSTSTHARSKWARKASYTARVTSFSNVLIKTEHRFGLCEMQKSFLEHENVLAAFTKKAMKWKDKNACQANGRALKRIQQKNPTKQHKTLP